MKRALFAFGLLLLLAGCGAQPANGDPPAASFPFPLPNGGTRITKKPFGIFVTPQHSPVQPERFRGYHTGTDFEILPGEEDTPVHVSAVCSGKIRSVTWMSGYGGVLVQDCVLGSAPVTVLYGHLKESSVTLRPGEALSTGQVFAELGKGYSTETDGERKHLHLAVHRGTALDYRGYVQKPDELKQWINAFP